MYTLVLWSWLVAMTWWRFSSGMSIKGHRSWIYLGFCIIHFIMLPISPLETLGMRLLTYTYCSLFVFSLVCIEFFCFCFFFFFVVVVVVVVVSCVKFPDLVVGTVVLGLLLTALIFLLWFFSNWYMLFLMAFALSMSFLVTASILYTPLGTHREKFVLV